jgi:hypothetical protein
MKLKSVIGYYMNKHVNITFNIGSDAPLDITGKILEVFYEGFIKFESDTHGIIALKIENIFAISEVL